MIPLQIVDADQTRAELYQAVLGRHFSIGFSADADGALAQRRLSAAPLVLISASYLGLQNALRLASDLKAQPGPLRILLLSADGTCHAPADAALPWPCDGNALKQAMRGLLASLAGKPAEQQAPAPAPAPTTPKVELPPPSAAQLAKLGLSREAIDAISGVDLAKLVNAEERLETDSYYDLLGVDKAADSRVLRRAYLAIAKVAHPDRYALLGQAALSDLTGRVFKAMAEAYQVLSDPEKRRRYDQQLAQGGSLRLDLSERPTDAAILEERSLSQQARKFYNLALAAQNGGDIKTARMNITLALSMDKGHPLLLRKKDELDSTGG